MAIEIQVACRSLAEFVHRDGGLSPISFSQLDAGSATRTHQAFYRSLHEQFPTAQIRSEVSVRGRYTGDDLTLALNGRADIVLEIENENQNVALEVKTVGVPIDQVNDQGLAVHWAQVAIYAWLLIQDDGSAREENQLIRYALAYVSREDLSCLIIYRERRFSELESWFHDTCRAYLSFAKKQKAYQDRSIATIRALRFPYPSLRDGQRQFMERVLKNLRSRTALLVEAPTGTGKTMSTLYPAIKGLASGLHKQVFYLTAKNSTREIARESINALREAGLFMRSVTMTAKEKLCLEPEIYCDTERCPYAREYYKKIGPALNDALGAQDFESNLILELAKKHRVCPFELQLDISLYSDVVICDYNYAFDPRVKLERFFVDPVFSYALLVDEAHNLPDRAREMFSAQLRETELQVALNALKQVDRRAASVLEPIAFYFAQLKYAIRPTGLNPSQAKAAGSVADTDPGEVSSAEGHLGEEMRAAAWPLVEDDIPAEQIMKSGDFRAGRFQAVSLIRKLGYACHLLRELLDDLDDYKVKQDVMAFYFSARFFLRVAEEFWSDRYITTAKHEQGGLVLSELCLDSSDRIVSVYRDRHSAVFFSATLTPLNYFTREFGGARTEDTPQTMVLASPFPRENLLLAVDSHIETTYKERKHSQIELARSIALGIIRAGGNSLVFFPSYSYMQQILPLVRRMIEKHPIDIINQVAQMSDGQRRAFLNRFQGSASKPVAGFAVLGGVFGEGIDLTGERLKAVIVVGVGLPQISPEREIMQQYYGTQQLGGFQFAYLYPGFNKVMQAAGRLIRSENDSGFILLIDKRYEKAEYRQLFPRDWDPQFCNSLEELNDCLKHTPE